VAEVTISPGSGGLGTPITIDLEPAIAPLAFDCLSTVVWEGVYQPPTDPATDPFKVSYAADQVCNNGLGTADIYVGDGTVANLPSVAELAGLGSLEGSLTLNLPGATLERSYSFIPQTDVGTFEAVDYPDGAGGYAAPALGGELASLLVMSLSATPQPLNPPENLLRYVGDTFHVATVVRVESDATTSPVFSNTTPTGPGVTVQHMVPGSRSPDGHWVADDIKLERSGGCQATGYEIAVHGGYGPDFDVHVELFNFYNTLFKYPVGDWSCYEDTALSIEGTGIPGTAKDFTGVSGNGVTYLYIPLEVALPEEMWVYVSFSTDEAGWVIAGEPVEVGTEVNVGWDCFGGNPDNGACQICFNFDTEDGNPLASMATQVYCYDDPMQACETPPAAMLVDVVSFDAGGFEIDRVEDLVLNFVGLDPGNPSQTIYHNDLLRPIVLVDVNLDEQLYPNVVPLYVIDGGSAVIVRGAD
jgi:hypothetical protein